MKKGISERFDEHEQDTAPRAYPKALVDDLRSPSSSSTQNPEGPEPDDKSQLTAKFRAYDLEAALRTESGTRAVIGPDAIERHVRAKIEDTIEDTFRASIASSSGAENVADPVVEVVSTTSPSTSSALPSESSTSESSSSSSSPPIILEIPRRELELPKSELDILDVDPHSRPTMEAVPASLTSNMERDKAPILDLMPAAIDVPITSAAAIEIPVTPTAIVERESSPSFVGPQTSFSPRSGLRSQSERDSLTAMRKVSIAPRTLALAIAVGVFLVLLMGVLGFLVGRAHQ